MNKQCDIVQDLLPLYVDDACSEASAEMIKEHMETCETCKEIYEKMCSHASEKILQKETDSVITRHERKEAGKIVRNFFFALVAVYIPALFIVSACAEADGTFIAIPYSFVLMVIFLYTFPFYIAFIQIGLTVLGSFEAKTKSRGQKLFDIVKLVLVVGIIITAIDIESMVMLSLTLSAALILCWIISAIVYKKKPDIKGVVRQKTFWVCFIVLIVCISGVFVTDKLIRESRNLRDDEIVREVAVNVLDSGSEADGVYFDFEEGDGIICNFSGKAPYIIADLVNDTDGDIEYDLKCYVYKKIDESYGLCSTDYITFPDDIYTLPAKDIASIKYSVSGYDIDVTEDGIYKFVVFVDENPVWLEFAVTVE